MVDEQGSLVAHSGDPDLRAFLRSAAKPFQALPLIQDGAADRFGVTPEELALACASHNSETRQVALVQAWLDRIRCVEADLACGPHRPLSEQLALVVDQERGKSDDPTVVPSPIASNCSGKHTGMLTLARHHRWPISGYHRPDHPVQQRCREEVSRWMGLAVGDLVEAVDGCRVVCFAVPVRAMALGFARLGRGEGAARRIVSAMTTHPDLVAGRGRLCTALMRAYPGRVVTKVGAAGIYGATLPERGLGIGLKVEDGDDRAAVVAILAILTQLGLSPAPAATLPGYVELPVLNTRREPVGQVRAVGELTFV